MSHPRFDPSVIEQYAEQLYRKADSVRVGSAVVGAILGVAFGAAPLSPVGEFLPVPSAFGVATVLLGGLVGGFIGYVVGDGRAFRIRLQAQMVLFQVQLERNTAQAAAPPQAAPVEAAPQPVVSTPAAIVQPAPAIPVLPARPAVAAAAPALVASRPPLGIVSSQEAGHLSDDLAPPLYPPLSPR